MSASQLLPMLPPLLLLQLPLPLLLLLLTMVPSLCCRSSHSPLTTASRSPLSPTSRSILFSGMSESQRDMIVDVMVSVRTMRELLSRSP